MWCLYMCWGHRVKPCSVCLPLHMDYSRCYWSCKFISISRLCGFIYSNKVYNFFSTLPENKTWTPADKEASHGKILYRYNYELTPVCFKKKIKNFAFKILSWKLCFIVVIYRILKLQLMVHCGLQQRQFHARFIYDDRELWMVQEVKKNLTADYFFFLLTCP